MGDKKNRRIADSQIDSALHNLDVYLDCVYYDLPVNKEPEWENVRYDFETIRQAIAFYRNRFEGLNTKVKKISDIAKRMRLRMKAAIETFGGDQ